VAKSHNIGRDLRIDINRVAAAAIDAALGDESATRERTRRHRVPGGRLILTGAALAAAARAGQKHMPALTKLRLAKHGLAKLNDLPNLRDVGDAVRDRFADLTHRDGDEVDDSEFDDAADDEDIDEEDDVDDAGDEPRDQGSDDSDEEDDRSDDADEEPRDEGSDDWDEGPDDLDESSEDSDRGADDTDDRDEEPHDDADEGPGGGEVEAPRLRTDTPDLVGALGARSSGAPIVELASRLDPAGRPPEPVARAQGDERSQGRRNTRSRRNRSTAARK
jgi:hypothetical protein